MSESLATYKLRRADRASTFIVQSASPACYVGLRATRRCKPSTEWPPPP